MRLKTTYEIEYTKDNVYHCLGVKFSGIPSVQNDGIGYYEFWGSKEYDKKNDYLEIDDLQWNDKDFTEEENIIIENYVQDNYEKIEKALLNTY